MYSAKKAQKPGKIHFWDHKIAIPAALHVKWLIFSLTSSWFFFPLYSDTEAELEGAVAQWNSSSSCPGITWHL